MSAFSGIFRGYLKRENKTPKHYEKQKSETNG
jgi:hypothetical protein